MPAARVCGATERVDLINLLWLTCIMISIYCVLLFNVATVSSPPPRADHLNFYYSGASPEFPPPRFIFQWVGMEPIARRLLPPSLCSIQLGPHTPPDPPWIQSAACLDSTGPKKQGYRSIIHLFEAIGSLQRHRMM